MQVLDGLHVVRRREKLFVLLTDETLDFGQSTAQELHLAVAPLDVVFLRLGVLEHELEAPDVSEPELLGEHASDVGHKSVLGGLLVHAGQYVLL